MTEQEGRLHVAGVGVVIRFDQSLDVRGILSARDIVAQDPPAVPNQILLHSFKFGRQFRRVRVIDDEDDFAAVLGQRRVDTGENITVTRVARRGFYYLILVGRSVRDVGIDKTRGRPRKSDAHAP